MYAVSHSETQWLQRFDHFGLQIFQLEFFWFNLLNEKRCWIRPSLFTVAFLSLVFCSFILYISSFYVKYSVRNTELCYTLVNINAFMDGFK